jgi:hypothetical protein
MKLTRFAADSKSLRFAIPQFGITKAGNVYLRSLLIDCPNHVLRPQGEDSSLRRWGLHLAARGDKQAKNRAVVALARKLAVRFQRIWTTQEPYMPFYAEAGVKTVHVHLLRRRRVPMTACRLWP